jgi:hypothetical protein
VLLEFWVIFCLPQCIIEYEFDLIIDGNRRIKNIHNIKWYESSLTDTNHIILLDVQLKANLDRIGRLHSENGWTRAEFQLVENGGKYMNLTIVHVREQIKNMPDIQFIDPKVPIKKTHTWDLEIAEKSQGLTLGYYHGDHMGI